MLTIALSWNKGGTSFVLMTVQVTGEASIFQEDIILSLRRLMCAVALFLCLANVESASALEQEFYKDWDRQLEKYVDARGAVNYRAWKGDRAGLDSFLSEARKLTAKDYAAMRKEDRLAFWINVYNAFTIKQILDHYPLKRSGLNFYPDNSIRQIDGVWDKFKILAAGKSVSLSDIENKILRGELREPLIHFAINCASKSCPKLLNRAYSGGDMIYKDMETAAFEFVNDKTRNKFDSRTRKVEISRIFEWFGDDFKAQYGSKGLTGRSAKDSAVINFLQKYLQGSDRDLLTSNRFSIGYLPYDWSLNEQTGRQ